MRAVKFGCSALAFGLCWGVGWLVDVFFFACRYVTHFITDPTSKIGR